MSHKSVVFFENKYHPKARYASNFSKRLDFRHRRGAALSNGDVYFAMSINAGGPVHHFRPPETASFNGLKEWVAGSFGDRKPTESDYAPGTVYKRIYRPFAVPGNFYASISQEKLTGSFVSLRMLLNKLEELFQTIEPVPKNKGVHGHKMREIILLACMEVESSWKAVLKENGFPPPKNDRWSTNQYMKLLAPMLLDSYAVSLRSYPQYPQFKPFRGWSPSKTLEWYAAYNETKHDRESKLSSATLDFAVQAVGAAAVMFHAQYGLEFPLDNQMIPILQNVFQITPNYKKYWRN